MNRTSIRFKKTAVQDLERLEQKVAAIESVLGNSTVFILKGVAEIDELTDIVQSRLTEKSSARQNDYKRRADTPEKHKKPAAPSLAQLEQRLESIEKVLKFGTIFALRGADSIDKVANVVEKRIEVRAILGDEGKRNLSR